MNTPINHAETIAMKTADLRSKLNQDNIPKELKALQCWVVWKIGKLNPKSKKFDKVPIYPKSLKNRCGTQGGEEDMANLGTFEEASAAFDKHPHLAGIGIALLEDFGIVALDVDRCVVDGKLRGDVAELTDLTYCESSPSGTGVRSFWTGKTSNSKNHADGYELFHSKGFVTVTGNQICNWYQFFGDGLPALDSTMQDKLEGLARSSISSGNSESGNVKETDVQDHDLNRAFTPLGVNDQTIKDLESALMGMKPERADEYQQWINILLGLASLKETPYTDKALELAHEFSQLSGKYDADELDRSWEGMDPTKITYKSIFQWAQEDGWVNPRSKGALTRYRADQVLESLVRNKNDEIISTMDNLTKVIDCSQICGFRVGYDMFREEIMYSADDDINWISFKDADYTKLRINLERAGFKSPQKEMIRDAVLFVANNKKFDSAQLWLNKLEWDGTKRVEKFLSEYLGTANIPYTRGVSRYFWSALAGRILSPGCKADMVPVLVGNQGTRKSSAVAALLPDPIFFCEISFNEKDDDLSRKMRGRLIAEIAELKGLNSKDEDHIKAFITKQNEEWIPKYQEFKTIYPRRIMFVGTTNRQEFLSDGTGNRRWLPVQIDRVIDVDRIVKDRDQLWAEAHEMYKAGGIDYKEAEALAMEVHSEYVLNDPWEPFIAAWLERPDPTTGEIPAKRSNLTTHEILQKALDFVPARIGRSEEMRVGRIMKKLGYKKIRVRKTGGYREYIYERSCAN